MTYRFVTPSEPPAMKRVLVWGNAVVRFGYRDERGQWRGLHNSPMDSKPLLWTEIPQPSEAEKAAVR